MLPPAKETYKNVCLCCSLTHKIKNPKPFKGYRAFCEVPTRFELVIKVLQTFALPLGYGTII